MATGSRKLKSSDAVKVEGAASHPRIARRVVGIDPGLNITGYAVVDPVARGAYVIEAGVIRPPSTGSTLGARLAYLHRGLEEVLAAFNPDALALERVS